MIVRKRIYSSQFSFHIQDKIALFTQVSIPEHRACRTIVTNAISPDNKKKEGVGGLRDLGFLISQMGESLEKYAHKPRSPINEQFASGNSPSACVKHYSVMSRAHSAGKERSAAPAVFNPKPQGGVSADFLTSMVLAKEIYRCSSSLTLHVSHRWQRGPRMHF